MRLHFGEFLFDTDRRELSRDGAPIHLTTKALQLLAVLLEQRPKILAKKRIYADLWPDTFVEESNLSVLICEIRAALDEDARHPRFIKTAHGFGYGFIGEVRAEAAPAMIRLRSGSREFLLRDGENIVGRDAGAHIRLLSDGISRRHARITVSGERLTIEDLGSKNGTYVDGNRVTGSRELENGDEVRFSSELLVVHVGSPARSTVTES